MARRTNVCGYTIKDVTTELSRRRLLTAAVLAGCSRKASGFPGYAFVANYEGRSVTAVNLRRFAVTRHILLDASPAAVIAHPREASVYVLTPASGTIHEIEAPALTLKRRTKAAQNALSMRLAGDGQSLWVLGREPRALIRVPLDTLRPAERIHLPQEPGDFELDRRPEAAWRP